MGWSVIRTATDEDEARLFAAQKRFFARHADEMKRTRLDADDVALGKAPYGCDENQAAMTAYLHKLYRAVVKRALGVTADGIAWGCVGRHVE